MNPEVPCVFPYVFRGKTYTDCSTDYVDEGEAWCATEERDFKIDHCHFSSLDCKLCKCLLFSGEHYSGLVYKVLN